ncbi:hypothetical protein MNBD_GAMMA16-1041 [hydrothermal vent metagenome]|uniref:Uncharacterized protein n=1 Tax=hydrothermal vent metagenome TaxID=652676 RepID=A0A3B0ZKU7_9ZZZZ
MRSFARLIITLFQNKVLTLMTVKVINNLIVIGYRENSLVVEQVMTSLEDIPVIKIAPVSIAAGNYNRIRLALLRLDNPLRIPLPGLRGMDLIADKDTWVCVDRTLYDLPVLAWTAFESQGRSSLHLPVNCQLNYYHIHANVIAETVLTTTDRVLQERLRPYQSSTEPTEIDTHVTALHR